MKTSLLLSEYSVNADLNSYGADLMVICIARKQVVCHNKVAGLRFPAFLSIYFFLFKGKLLAARPSP